MMANACGCKGIRSCALCSNKKSHYRSENIGGITATEECLNELEYDDTRNLDKKKKMINSNFVSEAKSRGFIVVDPSLKSDVKVKWNSSKWIVNEDVVNYDFCPVTGRIYLSSLREDKELEEEKPAGQTSNERSSPPLQEFDFKGVQIFLDFVTPPEEDVLVRQIEEAEYVNSQSGRRKQDFGPKVNFKKKKVKPGNFNGLPHYSRVLYDRMQRLPDGPLHDFVPVEMCNLEYCPSRGAHIDPHIDDQWLWGERLVTLNLLSDSVLTFTNPAHPLVAVRVPLARRSLLVVAGSARHQWLHAINPAHIKERRVAMTFRELSDEFRGEGKLATEGKQLVDLALTFNGVEIHRDPNISVSDIGRRISDISIISS